MNERYAGHNRGVVIMNDGYGNFSEHPMTRAELGAREVAASIQDNIYRYANTAGSCYHELWQMIANSIQQGMSQFERENHLLKTKLTIAISALARAPSEDCAEWYRNQRVKALAQIAEIKE